MNYIEVTISLDNIDDIQKDLLMNDLAGVGFESFVEQNNGLLAYVNQDELIENSLETISKDYCNFKFTKKTIKQENWNAQWESQFTPIIIDEFCIIRAPFHEPKSNFEFDIIIEPKMSFGTGHHATTRLMINQLRSVDVENKTVLDMGCGTGILAIVASKLNANKVDAIDIDQWASENTVENAQRNDIKNIYTEIGVAKDIKNKYDIILANINRNVLVADMPTYVEHLNANGIIAFSGFYIDDNKIIIDSANELGLTQINKLNENEWSSLMFKLQ